MKQAPDIFDLVVVGAGHAGCEAALAAARMGRDTLLVTINVQHLGALSCNPAVGGLAKGHLVREIDAMGGEMAKNTDACGLQFRVLNLGKGPAVWSSRAQVDIDRYPARLRRVCLGQDNLWVLEAEVQELIIEGGCVAGIVTQRGQRVNCRAVILTTGTFLRGVIHLGLIQTPAGRMGDPPSNALSDQLKELGFSLSRLKTGTTPRLDARSVDLSGLVEQPGDDPPQLFSFMNQGASPKLPQLSCFITRTSPKSHDIVRANLDQAPMYAGVIKGVGARYCPSIEDKVVRFPDKDSHLVFLEFQGLDNGLIYPNGIPTSLPLAVQQELVNSLPGCERAFIVRPGYAIEYDMSDPRDLGGDLQSTLLPGLYMAGQINGTSGYEEAACQGFWAGINAALTLRGQETLQPDRSRSYMEVLVDDLVTKGTKEPYRMFTSRAEYRLSLREDNADLRLTSLGRELGLVDDERWTRFVCKRDAVEQSWQMLETVRLNPDAGMLRRLREMGQPKLNKPMSAAEMLRRPDLGVVKLATLVPGLEPLAKLPPEVASQLEIRAHYLGYVTRECRQVERFKQRESVRLPPDIDYASLPGMSKEVAEKLSRVRPQSLGQAGRISGVTPAALTLLSLHLHQRSRGG